MAGGLSIVSAAEKDTGEGGGGESERQIVAPGKIAGRRGKGMDLEW